MPRLYFAHPINTYDTHLEHVLLARINKFFPSWEIVNPNHPDHVAAYQRLQVVGGNPMDYVFNRVLPECHGCISLPFFDFKWGAGVFAESKWCISHGRVVFSISHHGIIKLMRFNRAQVLTVEETRQRIRTPDGHSVSYFPPEPYKFND